MVQITYPSKTETEYGDLIIKNYFSELFCYDIDNYVDDILVPIRNAAFKQSAIKKGQQDLNINFSIRDQIQIKDDDFIVSLFDESIKVKGILNNTITLVKMRMPYLDTKNFYALPESV